ncbi:FHA domain-containing protein PS1 [Lolium rigidum]|uniref:FHA domain-containing protein PS1 n=1 Tax=Lolium rigidum TaxID=89674 RepID=UPI001F5D356B|nr:FHA domain-containing protein PS1 [Lolium rigidum]
MAAAAAAADAVAGTEAPIAAFAVAKGGVVLKHIFLNVPPAEEAPRGGDADPDEEDPPVLFGRHPDCHVLLDHPSISRRHLEVRCKRRQRRIAVTDLSSVHGTRVSGQRIPPNTPVELVAGDTLQLGASKREYRLHWLSLSEAFETEDLLPPLVEEDKEESHTHQEARNQLAPTQTEPLDTETHQEMILQVMSEQTEFCAEVIPSAPPLPESANSSSLKESLLSVLQEKIVSENSGTESVAPSTIQAARTLVQSDKQNASGTMSRRAKLKSVKSLRIDTGRRSRTLSHSCQKEEDQYENLVCSQNCKGECAACMVLFKNSDVREAEEKEKVIAPEKDHMNPHVLDIITMEGNQEVPTVHMESYEAVPENPFTHAITCGNTTNHPDMKYDDGGLSNKEKMSQNKIAMEDSELQGIIFGSIFDNLDTEGRRTEEKEENSLMDKENTTPLVSGNIITERSQLMLKPISSQELMDSISPLNLEHDSFSDSENSMLNIGNKMTANELTSENLETEFITLMSDEDFNNDIIPDKENSVLAPGKYDAAISPAKQEDLFPDENMTPASRDLKPIAGNILGSRMDSSVSAEYTSNRSKVLGSRMDSSLLAEYTPNRSIDQRKCNDLSSKSKRFHTVDDEVFYSDKENLTPISTGDMKARRCLPKNLFQLDADQDQETFCSDKENSTPASSVVQKTRDMSENRARIESAITKKRVEDRLPFQTLVSNSPLRPTSSFDSTQANAGTADFSIRLEDGLNSFPHKNRESDRVGEGMKVWTMVADTDCLLDDESMKSIMLLKGIKGTHLIIPRIVIRELDSMKQREGLFKRSTKATSTLQWIEECMANESWWIHVQSSSEMLPVAPTPPATPTEAQRSDGEREATAAGTFNTVLSLFSPRSFTGIFSPRSLTDIVSPRTEDRVLDCALLFNKMRCSQNMVILSNSVTLKIKAMSEGLLCEGAKEFRETLMNPCSGRFMWSASVPRGAAWSRLDETALAENYYNSHHHREARRNVPAARGLKLILLHNSSSLGAHAGDQLRRRDDAVAGSAASACW